MTKTADTYLTDDGLARRARLWARQQQRCSTAMTDEALSETSQPASSCIRAQQKWNLETCSSESRSRSERMSPSSCSSECITALLTSTCRWRVTHQSALPHLPTYTKWGIDRKRQSHFCVSLQGLFRRPLYCNHFCMPEGTKTAHAWVTCLHDGCSASQGWS